MVSATQKHWRQGRSAPLIAAAAALLALATPASAGASAEEAQQGAELLAAIERGDRECAELEAEELSAIGELVMGRMLGSDARHERADERISEMMGAERLDAMHEAMGRRFAGCGGGDLPPWSAPWFGSMMGGFGMMGGFDHTALGAQNGFGPSGGDSDAWLAAWLVIALGAGGAGVLVLLRRRGQPVRTREPSALEVLRQRCARGEISVEQYRELRAQLERDR